MKTDKAQNSQPLSRLTLQINNVEAIERLIGGDSQTELDLRRSIAEAFAQKHLKALANTDQMQTALGQIKNAIVKTVTDNCAKEIATFETDWYGGLSNIKLHSSIKSKIDDRVRALVQEMIKKSVDESFAFWAKEENIKKQVDERFSYFTKDFIDKEIKARLDKIKATL